MTEILVETLLQRAASQPQQPALVAAGETFSYGQLATMIRATAARIGRAIGGRGARVALCGPNSPHLAAAYFAVHLAGGVAVLLDADASLDTARWIVADAEAQLTLSARPLSLPGRVEDLVAWCQSGDDLSMDSPPCDPEAGADLIYTTGTTGRKKGVLLNHANIVQAARNINEFVGTRGDDREIMPLPLCHSFGLGRLRAMALTGHCLLLLPGMRNRLRS